MRISGEQVSQILAAQGAKGPKAAKNVDGVGPTAGPDAVSVSSMGQEIQKAMQALVGMPDIRADRVAELKARIDDGSYQVSGREVAETLLRRAADQLL